MSKNQRTHGAQLLILLVGLILTVNANADCFPNPSGLIGWWPGDGNANNLLGTNNGTLQGGATASAVGLVGNAFSFDGTNNFVQIPNSPILQPTNLTIEAWIKFTGLDSAGTGPAAGVQNIIFKQNTQSSSFEGFDLGKTRVSGSDYFRFIVSSGSGQTATIRSSTIISTGVWYHVAAVRGPNFTQLYINGVLERQTNVAFAQNYGTQPLYFGTSGQSFWDRRFRGSLDEVAIFDRALSSNEIAAIFAAGANGKCKAPEIVQAPLSMTATLGSNATFSVAANGWGNLVYQWRFNGANLASATNATLALTNVQFAQVGDYSVTISNELGLVISPNATLTVVPNCSALSSGLVGWWPGEASTSDISGSFSATTPYGIAYAPGFVGQAFDFNGTARRLSITDGPAFYFTNALTLEAWIYPRSYGGFVFFRGDNRGGLDPYFLELTSSGSLRFVISQENSSYAEVFAPTAPAEWTHIVATWDRTTGLMKLFTNGIFAAQLVTSVVPFGALDPAQEPALGIGNHGGTFHNNAFNGLIDEPAIYSRALAPGEVAAIYSAGQGGKCSSPTPPVIFTQPRNRVFPSGSTLKLTAETGGTQPLSHRWYYNGTPLENIGRITGADSDILTIANTLITDSGSYGYQVSNSLGAVTSTVATVLVGDAPVLQTLVSQTVLLGANTTFTAAAVGSEPIVYQWQFNGVSLTNDARISGATNTVLNILNASLADAGNYGVIAANPFGSASTPAVLTVVEPPSISNQPMGATIPAGTNFTFTFSALGTAPFQYQWHFNQTPLPNATNSALTLTNVQSANAGDYSVVVTNLYGSVTSADATLVVTPTAPVFTLNPIGRTVTKGAEVAFTAAAKGSEPITYQWSLNGTNITGASNATLTLAAAQFSDAGNYSVLASNSAGSTNSPNAVLNVLPPPGFLWTRKAGGTSTDEGRSMAMDAQGNLFVTGTYSGNAVFGTNNLVSVSGGNSADIFLAKYDPDGQLKWVRTAGSFNADAVNGVAVDPAGNVCIGGSAGAYPNFSGTILTNYGGNDAFIAKYSGAGDLLWVTNFGGVSTDSANAIAIDDTGRIFVTGSFNGTGFFGGTIISNTLNGAAFTARFSADGDAEWVRASAGNATASGAGIKLDSLGNIFVAGSFGPAFIAFGGITVTNIFTSPTAGFTDLFVAKYDGDGNVLWVQKAGGSSSETVRGLAVDGGGNSYVVGDYNGTATFGATTLTETPGFNQTQDVYVMKCDPSGNILWAKRAGGTSTDAAGGVAVDSGGNVFITGSYQQTGNFGGSYFSIPGTAGGYTGGINLTNSGGSDVFVAMLSTVGEFQWALRTGGNSTDAGRAIVADNLGNLFLAGSFSTTAGFGHQSFPSSGSTDFFLSKLAAFDADAPATLIAQTASQTNAAGSTITLAAGVLAPGPIGYQWQFNGTNIPSATNLSFTLVNVVATNGGAYSVNITTPNGNLSSTSAVLTVVTEPDFLWAKHFGGTNNDECLAVAADANGNTYAAGYFSGATDFGGTNLTSLGGEDGFVAKFNPAQNLVWLHQLGGTNHDRANALALDSAGNVIVAGQFSATIDFGGTNLTSFGSNDVFLAKFDATGALLWARQAGNTNSDFARSVAVHSTGDIAVAGQFQLNAVFDGVTVTNRNTSGWDVFVARYDSAGQLLWVQGAGGNTSSNHDDRLRGVAFDPAGNVLTCGSFLYGMTFGSVSLNNNRAGQEIFMVKYSPTGGVLWARSSTITLQTPQSVDDEAMAVASDRDGNIFLAGYFQNQITMASNTIFAANTNVPDLFLARYDANGNALWLRTAGGVATDSALALATDNSGNALLAGSFTGPAQFGSQTLSGIGGADAFAAMYDATGNLVKLRKLGGMGDDAAQGAAYDGRGNLVLGGFHTGASVVGNTPLPSNGGRDAFVAKLLLYVPDLAPLITTQPLEQTVVYGKVLDLAVGVTSGSTPSYQWFFNSAPLSGATNASLRLTNFQYAAVGNYSVIVTNGFGAATSSVATVTVELVPEFPWLQRAGSTGDDQAFALAMDSQTNLYMAGHFSGTALFTNGFFGTNISLVSTGLTDIFLTKHNAAGKLLWARRAGGTHEESAQSLAIDPAGNVLLTGYFRSSQVRFGSLVVTNGDTFNDLISDIFVAKYDPDGNPIWAKRAGGIGWDMARSIAVDSAGDAYITGYCYWLAIFGNFTLTNGSPNFTSPTNYFVTKYSSAGDVVWAKSAVGASTSPATGQSYGVIQGFGLCLDANTNVIVTGHFLGTANFGSGFLTNINSTTEGGSVFLTKYDRNGNLLWAKKGTGGATGVGQALRSDAAGNIYGTSFKLNYGTTYLLTKYDAGGNLIWSRTASLSCCTGGFVQGNALAFDADGDILMVGGASSSATVEGVNVGGYVAKYRPDGVPLWVMRAGAWGYGVVADNSGGAYLAGRYSGTGFFGPSSTNILAGIGNNDIFLVKIGVKSPTATPQAFVKTIATDAGTTLQVITTGTGPFAFQWRFNGTNIHGATGSSYLLSGAKWTNAGLYSVAISNTAGSFVSAAAAVNVMPKLYSEPSGNEVKLTWGGLFTLQSSTNPAGPFTDLPGAVSPHFYSTSNDPLRFFRLKSEPFALTISNQPGVGLTLNGAGISGYNFILLGSTNLVTWTPLGTNISPFTFTETNAAPQRYFRAVMAQ